MTRTQRIVTAAVASLTLVGVAGGGVAWASADAGTPATRSNGSGYCGQAFGTDTPMDAVARYLGLDRTELVRQLHDGNTLTEIAEAQGRSVAGLTALMERRFDAMMGSGMMSGPGMMNGSGAGMMNGSGAGMMGR